MDIDQFSQGDKSEAHITVLGDSGSLEPSMDQANPVAEEVQLTLKESEHRAVGSPNTRPICKWKRTT